MPADRRQTIRREMFAQLYRSACSVRALSQALGVSEKIVIAHIPHVARSAKARGCSLKIEPFCCRDCGFVFKRQRFDPPGRCPACKSSFIEAPLYRIVCQNREH